MDTISKHAKKLTDRYRPSKNSVAVIASAKELARLVLASDVLLKEHKRKMLSEIQWLISEVDGKYATRYRSRRVVDLAHTDPTSSEKIHHDHVTTRKEVTDAILEQPEGTDELLSSILACVVTKAEHDALKGAGGGWSRYKAAGIEVLDMSTNPPKLLAL